MNCFKNKSTRNLLAALLTTLFAISAFAFSNKHNFPHGVLPIYKTKYAIKIDGRQEIFWRAAQKNYMTKWSFFEPATDSDDLSASYRLLWDRDNFYGFFKVTDEDVRADNEFPWENDGVELYIDGDNSKTTALDDNDMQIRFEYGKAPTVWPGGADASQIVYSYRKTSYGYNLEFAIPLTAFYFDVEAIKLFGWEAWINDNDGGARQNILKWWNDNPESWHNPGEWGTAYVSDKNNRLSKDATEENATTERPTDFSLHQNYPNPFNPETRISFDLPMATQVELAVYNMSGQLVKTLITGTKSSGNHTITWNGSDDLGMPVTSGVYLYKIEAGNFVQYNKMTLLR